VPHKKTSTGDQHGNTYNQITQFSDRMRSINSQRKLWEIPKLQHQRLYRLDCSLKSAVMAQIRAAQKLGALNKKGHPKE